MGVMIDKIIGYGWIAVIMSLSAGIINWSVWIGFQAFLYGIVLTSIIWWRCEKYATET